MILQIILIIILVILFYASLNSNKIENYSHRKYLPIHYINNRKRGFYRIDYLQPIILSSYFKRNYNYPVLSQRSYCNKYPKCYPCLGWKFIGPPYCI